MMSLGKLLIMMIATAVLNGCQTSKAIWTSDKLEAPNGPICTIALGGDFAFCRDTRGGNTYQVPISSLEKYKAVSNEFWYELLLYVKFLERK